MIPKIIWQTHELPYEELPNFQKDIIKTWKIRNPEWEHRYADAEQRALDVLNYNETLYTYYCFSGKQHQSDIWRLVVTYTHGGFYADMDSVCIESIDNCLYGRYSDQELVCSSIGFQHDGINSSNFGAVKNSKIIKSIIDSLMNQYKNIGIENIPDLPFAIPENLTFSTIAQENKDLIYFNENYFCHSKDFKDGFDLAAGILYNGKLIDFGFIG